MTWETPSFVEVRMDAEINSYQDDFRDDPDAKEPSNEIPSSVFVAKNANNNGPT